MTARTARALVGLSLIAGLVACIPPPPPVVPGTPAFPDFPALDVPAAAHANAETLASHQDAWRLLQSGDIGGAKRAYAALLKRTPAFFPAETGLGFVALAGHDYKSAAGAFTDALTKSPTYLPALDGRVAAALALGDDATAVDALQAELAIDPNRAGVRNRLEVVQFRLVQTWIESARRSRGAGRLDEAEATLQHALTAAPSSAIILRELALVELARGDTALPAAEAHARKAIEADPGDAESWAALGDVLDREKQYRDAADAYGKAVAIDPRPPWRDRHDSLEAKANDAAQPAEFRSIGSAATVTRADVAAMIGLRLGEVLSRSSRHVNVVATDVRGQWAATWILEVLQAGVMDVFPNHTFQPLAEVRRGDLAQVASAMLSLIAADHPTDLVRWKAAAPAFADLPRSHLSYPAAAVAVASGVMAADGPRFALTRAVTGAELVSAVARLQQIAAH